MTDIFNKNLNAHIKLFSKLGSLASLVNDAARIITDSLASGGTLYLCGNGGSAADSQHIAAEFTGRFVLERHPLAAIALTTDTSALTAIANDYGFCDIFSRQLGALARSGDCLIGISTSGNSQNIVNAVDLANSIGVRTIGFLGGSGGALNEKCEFPIVIPSDVTARIQEAHILIGHTLCEIVERALTTPTRSKTC